MMYLVWSNEHGSWWRAGRRGYTHVIEEAGRFTWQEAQDIVNQATVDGRLFASRLDPTDGRRYRYYSEVTVMAPESAPEILGLVDDEHLARSTRLAAAAAELSAQGNLSLSQALAFIRLASQITLDEIQPEFQPCTQGTPEGPCDLRKGHPVGPMWPGHNGHLARP